MLLVIWNQKGASKELKQFGLSLTEFSNQK